MEQERLGTEEVAAQAEFERLELKRIQQLAAEEQAEDKRLEQERLATEEAATQAEFERLELE